MAGVQRFLANDRNILALPATVITTTNVKSATGTVIRGTPDRQGFGRITVAGTYTGIADAEIDIEITSGTGTGVRVSQPVFVGAGNGTISDLDATGLDPQSITVRLVSTGTTTTSARLELGDIALVAKVAGEDGNGIALTITPSLTLGAAIGALPASVSVGQSSWTGTEWDWGAPALLADGTLPSAAPRVTFGGDTSAVYRIYKQFIGGGWTYYVTPAISKAVPAGAAVQPVTGDYDATLTQDATEEDFEGVTTLYDLARSLENSTLVTVDGVIVNDRAPGGLGVLDLPYRTISTARVTNRTGSKTLMDASLSVTAATGAASQIVTVECTDNTVVGAELWSVISDVNGTLGEATSGREFSDDVVFTIPQVFSDSDPLGVVLTQMDYVDRTVGQRTPEVCLRYGTQGAKAQTKTLTLTYGPPQPTGCSCADARVSGRLDAALLGLEEIDMATLDPEYSSRLTALSDYMVDFVDDQMSILTPAPPATTVWDPSTTYATSSPGTMVTPPVPNGHYYEIITTEYTVTLEGGTPNTITLRFLDEPAWPVDGSVYYMRVDVASYVAANNPGVVVENVSPSVAFITVIDKGLYNQQRMTGAAADIDAAYQVIRILSSCLTDTWSVSAARTAWDALWSDAQTDLTAAAASGEVSDVILDPIFLEKYNSRVDQIRLLAGLLPKKFEASSTGSAVWRDHPDQWRWKSSDGYLPWFDNEIGYTAKMVEGVPISTQEAAFALACSCPEFLLEGDTATINILSRNKTYAIGDKFIITVSGGQSLSTSGGVTGDDTLTWAVQGAVDAFADYGLAIPEVAYSDNGLEFLIERGAVDFAVGDEFRFSVEAQGEFKWRQDGGAWEAAADIEDGDLGTDGLTVAFSTGVAPAFVNGDSFSFTVVQPYAVDHLVDPLPLDESYQWTGADTEIAIDLGSAQTLTAIGLLVHTIPSGATITLMGGTTAEALDWTEVITWRAGPIVTLFSSTHACRYLILSVETATGGSIGWLWLGQPLSLSKHAVRCELRREHLMARSSGVIPTARSLGDGWAGELEWEHITQTDVDALVALWDGVKAGGDEPIGFLPHHLHPDETVLVGLAGDSLPLNDYFSYQPNSDTKRRLSCTLPLRVIPQ